MWSAWQDEARGGQCAVAGGESSLGGADRECAVEVDVTRGGVGVSVVKLNARMAHQAARSSASLLDLSSPTSQRSLSSRPETCPEKAKERSWCWRATAMAQPQWLWNERRNAHGEGATVEKGWS